MTAYRTWSPRAALLLLAALLSVVAVSALPHTERAPPERTARFSDYDLYRTIVARVARGGDYYSAAVEEQRAHGYPTAPAIVFRQPWLAWMLAALPLDCLRSLAAFPLFALLSALTYRGITASQP